MFIRPESIFIKNENNNLDNIFSAKVNTIEFEGKKYLSKYKFKYEC